MVKVVVEVLVMFLWLRCRVATARRGSCFVVCHVMSCVSCVVCRNMACYESHMAVAKIMGWQSQGRCSVQLYVGVIFWGSLWESELFYACDIISGGCWYIIFWCENLWVDGGGTMERAGLEGAIMARHSGIRGRGGGGGKKKEGCRDMLLDRGSPTPRGGEGGHKKTQERDNARGCKNLWGRVRGCGVG